MEYSTERITAAFTHEVDKLIHDYYEATPAKTDIPPYDFDWQTFILLERSGNLLVTTARDEGSLVGVAIYIVADHSHHRGLCMAECDTIAVDYTRRGEGIGRSLYTYTEQVLIYRGVKMITNRYRTCYHTKPMFEELGFVEWERVYMKKVG